MFNVSRGSVVQIFFFYLLLLLLESISSILNDICQQHKVVGVVVAIFLSF